MTAYNSLWQLMTAYDSFWQLMTAYDSLWQLMTAYDNFWPLLTAYDSFWQFLTTFDNLCIHCMLFKLSSSQGLVVGLVFKPEQGVGQSWHKACGANWGDIEQSSLRRKWICRLYKHLLVLVVIWGKSFTCVIRTQARLTPGLLQTATSCTLTSLPWKQKYFH